MYKTLLIVLLSLTLFAPAAFASGPGESGYHTTWQTSETTEESVQRLWAAQPSVGELMLSLGLRYQNLYWAAKQGQWEFAEYQTEEMHEALETIPAREPELAETLEVFLEAAYPDIQEAAASKDWDRFSASFDRLRENCMACHSANDHGFIRLPIPKHATSPVLNME